MFEPYHNPVVDAVAEVAAPARHRRVTGHFDGTAVGFCVYLPPPEVWQGRFFQYTYPMPIPGVWEGPDATERAISFALAHGGHAVQAGSAAETVLGFRHAAAAAEFARSLAADYYGHVGRVFGYLHGPSGGSFQTVGAMEQTEGIWDGFVPTVLGTPISIPGSFFIREQARLILAGKAEQIADAIRPGGAGDPFAGLDQAESAMLAELLAYGAPLGAWASPDYLLGITDLHGQAGGGLMDFGPVVRQMDPTYAADFWTRPGYLGAEDSPLGERMRALLAQDDTEENRWALALPSYYRHQVPEEPDWYGFNGLRNPDGTPRYPQRPLVGPLMAAQTTGGATYSGRFHGKCVVVDALGDSDALPWHADWYAKRARAALGEEFDNQFRVYYQENSDHHEQTVRGYRATHLVDYMPTVEQALADLVEWVEHGVAAPPSTRYTVQGAQVTVPDAAAERKGIQPTATLTVLGAAAVGIGQPVNLHVRAEAPVGLLVGLAWDASGTGVWESVPLDEPGPGAEASRTVVYGAPGVYFPAVKVTAQRTGEQASRHCRVQNLARARVVVGPA
ncbi:MAG: hypothetical protein LBD77_09820 [Bifidobacteriaceae bacterium]|jgi:hypothetical protein|nr:hypothetical protein [Bifidobacteriaceae bacterium]